jgi:hypothetical protein
MSKLSDTQVVILSAASQRDEGAVLPLPEALKIRGGAVDKVLGSLKAKGLIEHRGSRRGDNPPPLRITRAGLEAIGIEPEDAGDIQRIATEGARLADAADVEGRARRSGPPADTQHGAAATPTPRAGTKQALMIALLERPEGATVEQIAAATGWQHHTIRVPSPARSRRSSAWPSKRSARARSAPTRPALKAAAPFTGSPGRIQRLGLNWRLAEGATTMHGVLKRPGYRLYAPDSPEVGVLLVEQGLSPADLDRALACLERSEGIRVRTIVGINEDGVFGTSRAGWRADLPDAYHEPFIPLLWLKVHELLGKVPGGSTARLVQGGTLPGEAQGGAPVHRMAS